jgi:hypothetical protein
MPDPTLQGTALRYAASDLTPAEIEAFEARLAEDQDARDALAEAVRLSAAAIGQKPPAPDPSLRAAFRARLARLGAPGHPLAWVALGAAAVAACTLIGLTLAEPGPPDGARAAPRPAAAPAPTSAAAANAPAPHLPEPPAPAAAPVPHETATAATGDPSDPAQCGDESRSIAEIWADLSTLDHVEKAHDDELRWRQHVHNLSHPQHLSAIARTAGPTDSPQP